MKKGQDIAIVGYGETKITLRGGRSAYDLAGEVLEQILERTGIDKSEIDGLAVGETMSETGNPFWGVYLCEMLGLTPSWMQLNGQGGEEAGPAGGQAEAIHANRKRG